MNKIFYRTKLNGFLMSDSDIKVESAFYPPYVEDGGLDIGNNDPLIKGAIASKDIDGVPCLFIYQGLDVDDNQIWQQVGENIPSIPDIKLWQSGDSIKINKYVTHPVDGFEYQFRSNIDDNVSEPTLSDGSIPAWTNLGPTSDGFSPSLWSNSTTYGIGDFARISASSKNIFKSKVAGNLNHQPLFNTTDAYWECVGTYTGLYPNGAPYDLDEVAFDTTTGSVYKSNVASNDYALDAMASGTWALIGYVPTSLTLTESSLTGSDGNYVLSFNLPTGKEIASISTKQGTVTKRIPVSLAETDTANDPNTIIGGFDNNNTQIITIKFI